MLSDFNIDKSNRLPYYCQVYDYLFKKIKNGDLKEGFQLPNELELCDKFKVSRTTIREALRELELNGYITRGRGRGTFISKKSVESSALQKVSSIVDELKEKGVKTETSILAQEIIEPAERIQRKLNIDKNTKALYIERLMSAENEPLYITRAYFPYDVFKEIHKKYLVNLSFTKILEEYFKVTVIHRKRVLQPDIPDKKTIEILQIKKNEKKVVSYLQTFWTFDYNGKTGIIYFEEYFKSPNSKFVFES